VAGIDAMLVNVADTPPNRTPVMTCTRNEHARHIVTGFA